MASEQYCLRWNDHRTILLTNFERLLQSNTSVDCTLAAEGKCLRAHKVVLSACSPYLELMLNQEKEKHPIIFLKDMKYKELQAILEYMYRGEVVIPHDQLTSLLQVAESLQIKGLGCGEKSQPQTGNRGLIQAHQPQPQPPPVQMPKQSPQVRQPAPTAAPAIRGLEVTQVVRETVPQVVREAPPQVVDLTDEPRPPLRTPTSHHPQDATKRPLPQNTNRAKRVAFPAVMQERFNQNLANASPTTMQNVYQLQNVLTNAGQIGGTSIIASPIPVTSIPPKQHPAMSRPTNESGGPGLVQVLMPPTHRPETHDNRDAGNHPEAQKQKPRTVSRIVQRKPVPGNAVQASPVQGGTPVAPPSHGTPPSQNTAIAGTPRIQRQPIPSQVTPSSETAPPAETNSAGRAVANGNSTDKVDLNVTATPPPEVETSSSTHQPPANDTEPQEAQLDAAAEPAEEVDAEEPSLESPKEPASKKSPAGDKPGPSGVGKAKPGRRGRGSATERRFHCPECDKRFTQKCYLENHLRIHDGECYECDTCTKTLLSRAALLKHLRAHAAKASAAAASSSAPSPTHPQQHKCQLCGATFPAAAELEKHLTDHTLAAADDN